MPLWIKVPSQESFGASFGESAWRLAVPGMFWVAIDFLQRGLRHWVAATGNASGESTSGADSPWHG